MTHEIWLAIGCGVTAASALSMILFLACAVEPKTDTHGYVLFCGAVVSVFVAVASAALTSLCW